MIKKIVKGANGNEYADLDAGITYNKNAKYTDIKKEAEKISANSSAPIAVAVNRGGGKYSLVIVFKAGKEFPNSNNEVKIAKLIGNVDIKAADKAKADADKAKADADKAKADADKAKEEKDAQDNKDREQAEERATAINNATKIISEVGLSIKDNKGTHRFKGNSAKRTIPEIIDIVMKQNSGAKVFIGDEQVTADNVDEVVEKVISNIDFYTADVEPNQLDKEIFSRLKSVLASATDNDKQVILDEINAIGGE